MGHKTTRAIQYASYEAHKKDVGQLAGNMEAPSEAEERERMLSEPP